MSVNILNTNVALMVISLHIMVVFSSEMAYRYWRAQGLTLKELDLKTIEGKWFCLHQRKQLDPNTACHQIYIDSSENYINVTLEFRSWDGLVTNQFNLEQNKYLSGKLKGFQWIDEELRISHTWLIIQVIPNLIIFQITGQKGKLHDNWLIYGRSNNNSSLEAEALESANKLLLDAGAYPDFSGNITYPCLR